ncbi:hypothetical protein BKA93DRAFT_749072 [Sparassis latifolia]
MFESRIHCGRRWLRANWLHSWRSETAQHQIKSIRTSSISMNFCTVCVECPVHPLNLTVLLEATNDRWRIPSARSWDYFVRTLVGMLPVNQKELWWFNFHSTQKPHICEVWVCSREHTIDRGDSAQHRKIPDKISMEARGSLELVDKLTRRQASFGLQILSWWRRSFDVYMQVTVTVRRILAPVIVMGLFIMGEKQAKTLFFHRPS